MYINFLLASHRNKHETVFLPCIAFDGLAIAIDTYISVGDRVVLHGNLVKDKYKKQPYSFKLQVSRYEFVETIKDHEKHREKHFKKSMENSLKGAQTDGRNSGEGTQADPGQNQ